MDEGRRNLPVGTALTVKRRMPSPKAQRAALMAPQSQGLSQLPPLSWGKGRGHGPEPNIQKQSCQWPPRTNGTARAFPERIRGSVSPSGS